MAVGSSIKDKIVQWLGLGNPQETTTMPRITGYNPEITLEHTTSAPYTLTVTEKTYSWKKRGFVYLRTVITYDAPYPCGKILSVGKQKQVDL